MKKYFSLDHRLLENFCWPLLLAMFGLCACGLLNLYSVSAHTSFIGELSWFTRQCLFLGLAAVVMLLTMTVDYQYLKKIAWILYALDVVFLIVVFKFGVTANGATRWLDFGLFRFQPSETIKIVAVITLAAWFAKRDVSLGLGFKDFFVPALIILLPCFLILRQPDLGTALHLAVTCGTLFLVFKFRPQVLIAAFLLLALGIGLTVYVAAHGSWQMLQEKGILRPHQIARIETFLDPYKDPTNKGFQVLQSKTAVGGGQLFGRGFMGGPQHKNGFVPEAETDFAFAALAEEWGFVGCLAMLTLFLWLLSSGLTLARRSRDRFGSLIALGLTSLLFWQVVINVGMVIGLLPVVGIPLPFISYGGTSLVVTVAAVGLILNIGMRRYLFQAEPVRENPYVWQQPVTEEQRLIVTVPIRRLAADTPFNPEIHPRNRLPHVRPWAKYLRRGRSSLSGWQTPDTFEVFED
ncbi:MAG: rod shape-determining protein RodA [Candidatus Adiutrix sp.]|jgi:rod shape determining protein RodA|nr:rod shape-determining protein RodA [Candidatus Adiutrix sp.]